jgi:flavin-dependent dehydrogenase
VVIGADGANSVVRRAVTGTAPPARHVGVAVRAYAPAAPGPPELLLVWERAGALAYAWSFPIDGGRSNVGYGVFGTVAPPSRARLVERLRALVPHSREADPATVRGHRLPLSSGGPRLGAGRVLLAGDAACLINPITGEGIYYALLSGRLAASAALRAPMAPAPGYRATLGGALGAHVRDTRWVATLARRGRLLDLLVGAAAVSPTTSEVLADLAFGKGVLTPRSAAMVASALARAWTATRRQETGDDRHGDRPLA